MPKPIRHSIAQVVRHEGGVEGITGLPSSTTRRDDDFIGNAANNQIIVAHWGELPLSNFTACIDGKDTLAKGVEGVRKTRWRPRLPGGLRSRFVMMAVALSAFFGIANNAQAAWTICNQVAEDMLISIAYVDPRGGFLSEGSWRLRACGGCQTVLQRNQTSDPQNVFFRADGFDGFLIDGDDNFCVGESPFKLSSRNRCQRKGFRQVQVNLDKNWTTRITGKSSSGRRCYGD